MSRQGSVRKERWVRNARFHLQRSLRWTKSVHTAKISSQMLCKMKTQFVVYSSVLNRSHVATFWNFDPYYNLPDVTQIILPKMFQIVAMWLLFCTEEY